MYDDIRAPLERLQQVRRRQRYRRSTARQRRQPRNPSRSLITPPGLAMLSQKIARVLSVTARLKLSASVLSAQRTCQSYLLNEWVNWLTEPP